MEHFNIKIQSSNEREIRYSMAIKELLFLDKEKHAKFRSDIFKKL